MTLLLWRHYGYILEKSSQFEMASQAIQIMSMGLFLDNETWNA